MRLLWMAPRAHSSATARQVGMAPPCPQVRLVFEHLHTGGVYPFADVRTARLLPYDAEGGPVQLALDGLVIAWVSK